MSPQPTTPAAPTQHAKGSPRWLVEQARHLEKERAALLERIDANRSALRNLMKADALEDDLKEFVNVFYPEKTKGTARSVDEVNATRELREKVRKG